MKDEPVKICPKCKGEVKRLIGTGAGPIFKGTGFYQTDYKNSSNTAYKKAAEKAEVPKKTSESKPDLKGTTDK